jgi:hypothetical protein
MANEDTRYPTRLPVWWGRHGSPGPHPLERGVSGKLVTLRIEKKFNRLEAFIRKVLRGPRELKRPLDDLNSVIWELADGTRSVDEIVGLMDITFHEKVAPAKHRTEAALMQMQQIRIIAMLKEPFEKKWHIGPGQIPDGQKLDEIDLSNYSFEEE